MDQKKFKTSGILFIIAALLMIFAGFLGKRSVFTVIGCSFLIIGGGMLARSKRVEK